MSGLWRLCDIWSGVIIVVFRMRDSRHGGHSLWATHRPAKRAALRGRVRHRPPATPAAPASHNRTVRRRLRDCRHNQPRSFFKFLFFLINQLLYSHGFSASVFGRISLDSKSNSWGASVDNQKSSFYNNENLSHCFHVYSKSLLL